MPYNGPAPDGPKPSPPHPLARCYVRLDPPRDGFPPLMVVYKGRLSEQAIENMRTAWRDAWTGPPHRPVILEDGPDIHQLIDGRWQPLQPSPDEQ
jgi:hypothetical protein